MKEMYFDAPDGLAGNEDCGQMSAWYVLSALGIYEVTPGSNEYIIGAPLFPEAAIHFENGKTLYVKAKNVSNNNFYIQSATFNGQAYTKSFLLQQQIANGGNLSFIMGEKASSFGSVGVPLTTIEDNQVVINPVIEGGNDISYSGNKTIGMSCNQAGVKIFYTIDGQDPTNASMLY